MPSKDEKARRKEILHSLRNEERRKLRESAPAPISSLRELFDYLDLQLSNTECDGTLRFTHAYVRQNAMDKDLTIQWFEQHGGHCDCEVLNNVEPSLADAVPGYDRIGHETGNVN
jgi:hypothetical protein